MGLRSLSGVAVRAVSLPVLRSLIHTSLLPERSERNTSLLPSGDIVACAFRVTSFVILARSPRTLPSRASIGTDQMSMLRVRLANAIWGQRSLGPPVPVAGEGCSSSPVPIVSRSGVPEIWNDLREIGTFQRFVVSPIIAENNTSSPDQAAGVNPSDPTGREIPCCLKSANAPVLLASAPPEAGATHQSEVERRACVSRVPENRMYFPSGDQMGCRAE